MLSTYEERLSDIRAFSEDRVPAKGTIERAISCAEHVAYL